MEKTKLSPRLEEYFKIQQMGGYLALANNYLQKFKPMIEERTGIKLEDTVIKAMKDLPEDERDKLGCNTLMYVTSGRYTRPGFRTPNSIYVNEEKYKKMSNASKNIPIAINHELSHLVHSKILDEKIRKLKNIKPKIAGLVYKTLVIKGYNNHQSFREGFSEYMSLDHLADVYDKEVLRGAVLERIFMRKPKPYERGYRFFQKILSIIGKEKVFDVAKSLPISEIEMKMPLLYVLRHYPIKGIRNISKFLERGTSIDDRKNMRLFNYIVNPPPIVEKGSGKNKIFKPLQAKHPRLMKKGSGRGKVFKALPVTKS